MITGRLVTAVADSAPATNNSKSRRATIKNTGRRATTVANRAPGANQKSFKTNLQQLLHQLEFYLHHSYLC